MSVKAGEPHFFLSRVVQQLLDVASSGRAQALISSHSASVLSRIAPERIRHLRLRDSTPVTEINEISLPDNGTEAGKYIREAVRAHPELYFARFVILGEGDSEELVLPLLAAARGLHMDQSFAAVVPLGGRHTNHFWRLLNQLRIPHATLLDLDWGRAGGGEGRLRDACRRLTELGHDPFSGIEGYESEDDISDLTIPAFRSWLDHLESFGVYFSTPLDLDMLLLTHFFTAYTTHLEPGAKGPSSNGDPRDAVLGDEDDRPDVALWKDDKQAELLKWYRYHFLSHSKPSTHLRHLSFVGEELATLPPRLGLLQDPVTC